MEGQDLLEMDMMDGEEEYDGLETDEEIEGEVEGAVEGWESRVPKESQSSVDEALEPVIEADRVVGKEGVL